jgi:RNA polymerase sigma factor (TIGR02999 family)
VPPEFHPDAYAPVHGIKRQIGANTVTAFTRCKIAAAQDGCVAESSSTDVTRLLVAWQEGHQDALERLIPLVYAELHRLAHSQMAGERAGHTLQTTALVHETYLRLVDGAQVSWKDRAHFFAVCARLMRRILVDRARARHARKRGGAALHVTFEDWLVGTRATEEEILAVDELLVHLAAHDHRRSRVVELRYFGGLTVEETAAVLSVSPETVTRDWKVARLWLLHELRGERGAEGRGH